MEQRSRTPVAGDAVYDPKARAFHWITVAFVVLMPALGFYMVYRGSVTNFDAWTGRLYDLHKLSGFLLLWLVVARLSWRLKQGAPPDEPTLEWWQRAAAHLNHWTLYALLFAIPLLGLFGVSLYGARSVFGLFSLPALTQEDKAMAETVFLVHRYAVILLLLVAGVHIAAAMYHYFIRQDGVLRRMLPSIGRRTQR